MSSPAEECPTCGQPLAGFGGADAVCLACLWATGLKNPANDLSAEAAGWAIPGHDLMEELSRGGMGIVYRAMQHQPKRQVALKMLLPAHCRSESLQDRFRVEAAALAQLEQALRPERAFDPATSRRRFTVAMTDVGEMYFMPRLIAACAQLAPRVDIASARAGQVDLRTDMESGRVDLAIGAFEDAPKVLYQRRLFQQSCVTLFRRGHPLSGETLTVERLGEARHLVVTSMESPYDAINQALARAGIDLAASFSVPHFAAVPYIVSTTELVATVPQKLAERAAGPFQLEAATSPLKLAALQTNMFWHRRYHQDEGSRWLRALIAEHFAE